LAQKDNLIMKSDTGDGQRPVASKGLRLRVTEQEHIGLKREADQYGYDLSTLLRLRIFGKVKGMRITRRPSTDMMLLGDIIGKLTALTGEVNKLGSNLNQIAKRLNKGSRDTFGLDGCLRLFEQVGQKLFRVLNLIEAAITGRQGISTKED
jgi:hypothetical protein